MGMSDESSVDRCPWFDKGFEKPHHHEREKPEYLQPKTLKPQALEPNYLEPECLKPEYLESACLEQNYLDRVGIRSS